MSVVVKKNYIFLVSVFGLVEGRFWSLDMDIYIVIWKWVIILMFFGS